MDCRWTQKIRHTCRCLSSIRLHLTLAFIVGCAVIRVSIDSLLYYGDDDDVTRPSLADEENRCNFTATRTVPFVLHSARLERDLVRGTSQCPSLRLHTTVAETNSGWQYQNTKNGSIIVYSAFYDDRTTDSVTPWIRAHGVASVDDTEQKIFCHVWFDGCGSPYITAAEYKVTGRRKGYVLNGRTYVQYLFSCRLPGADPVPTHVSFVADEKCVSSTMFVPVERTVRAEPDHDFGVCVAISFGSIPTPEFVEWIELNRMFGVTEFNIYDGGMTEMTTIFDYYVKLGILKVHSMPPPVKVRSHRFDLMGFKQSTGSKLDSIKLSSSTSLNDCLMRNTYRYRYVIVIDFDEVIIPRIHGNYSQMMKDIMRKYPQKSPITSYIFRNAYFFLNFQPDLYEPSHIRSARYRFRADVSPFKMAPKSFINPRSCLTMFNHFCHIPLLQPSTADLISSLFDVSPSLATSHHYRKCDLSEVQCEELMNQKSRDDVALRFKGDLQRRVEFALTNIQFSLS